MSKNKTYRKYAVTTMAAAAAVASVAPVVTAAETSFSDVTPESVPEHYDSIMALVGLGAIDGYEDGTFRPWNEVKRGQVAKIVTEAVGLPIPSDVAGVLSVYSDVDENSDFADYIAAATQAGIFGGDANGNFNEYSPINRQQIAKVVVEAFDLDEIDAEEVSINLDKVDDIFKDYVQTLANLGITDVDAYNGHTTLKRASFASFAHRTLQVLEAEKNKAPEVESVSAINATQVEVKFNVEVDKDSAEDETNYSINTNNAASAELGDDKKTVTLTFSSQAHVEVTNGIVVIEPITLANDEDKETEKWTSVLTYKDEVKPEIDSVESKTNGTHASSLTVTASEPIASGNAKVNGEYYTISWNGTEGTINGLNLDASESHTLELINLTDLAGTANVTVSTSKTFNVTVDKVAPTATLSAEGDKAIKVTFSKPMDVATVVAAFDADTPVKDEALAGVNSSAVTAAVADTNDTEFIIPITAASIYANKDSRTFHVVLPNTLEDKLGNKLESTTKSITLTKDTVKPAATGYKVVKNNDGEVTAIEVNFSEGLAAAAQAALDAPTIVDSNGRVADNVLGTLENDAVTQGDKKVIFKAGTPAKLTGEYAFSFASELVSDLAETANKSNAFNYTIDFGSASTTFDLDSATATGNVITVDFGRAVKGGAVANSATDASNYSLAGKPLPEGTKIVLNSDQDVATITLPSSDSVEKDDATAIFTVANVHSLAGDSLNSYKGTVAIADNTAPVLESAKVLDNKTIELTYSEAIQLDVDGNVGDSFEIKQGDTVLSLANAELEGTVASGFDKKLVLVIDKGTTGTPAVPASATISNDANNIANIADGTTANADETIDYTVTDDGTGTLEVIKDGTTDVVATLDGSGNGTFIVNGVTVTITGGADSNTFTVETVDAVAAVPGTTTTLDLTKEITIETLNPGTKNVVDKSAAKNQQKNEVKVTVVKP